MIRDVRLYLLFIGLSAVLLTAAGLLTLVFGVGGLTAEMKSAGKQERFGRYEKGIRSRMAGRVKAFRKDGKADYVWPTNSMPWGVKASGRTKYGYFAAANGVSVGWARLDDGRVIGFEMEPFRYEDRRSLYLIGTVMVVMLFLVLLSGGLMLARTATRARRELETKDTFLDFVSHELNTPLGSIVPLSSALAAGGIKDERRRREAIATISRESARMARMIDELLTVVRLRNGKIAYAQERFDLCEAVQSAVELVRARHPDCAVMADCGRPVMAFADRDKAEQIAVNLIDNACRHAGDEAVEVVCAESAVGGARLAVLDRGAGMTDEQRKHVFERFYQAPAECAAPERGLGLGLSIVAEFAKGMGGTVEVAARPGGGSVFAVELPGEGSGASGGSADG